MKSVQLIMHQLVNTQNKISRTLVSVFRIMTHLQAKWSDKYFAYFACLIPPSYNLIPHVCGQTASGLDTEGNTIFPEGKLDLYPAPFRVFRVFRGLKIALSARLCVAS
ncbi:MAG: hypothetical protein ACOCZS_04865, partial [Verrucomicrobiota bacterium]